MLQISILKQRLRHYVSDAFMAPVIFLMWLTHRLPLPVHRFLSRILAGVFRFSLALIIRKKIRLTNLRLCFPGLAQEQVKSLMHKNLLISFSAFFDYAWLWWHDKQTVFQRIKVNIVDCADEVVDQPVIFLLPHFFGLDAAVSVLPHSLPNRRFSSIYMACRNRLLNKYLYQGRKRFLGQDSLLIDRKKGIKEVVRYLRASNRHSLIYLPDMDFGEKNATFVPFFGIPAATTTGLSRLVKITNAQVFMVTVQLVGGGYTVTVKKSDQPFTGLDGLAETALMNRLIEQEVRQCPEQYIWQHRRFKSRPQGEPGLY